MDADAPSRPLTPQERALVQAHRDVVVFAARHQHRDEPEIPLKELESLGMLKLCECATRYDPSQAAFKTFATFRVTGALRDAVRKHRRQRGRYVSYSRDELFAGKHHTAPERDASASHHAPVLDVDQFIDPVTSMNSRAMRGDLGNLALECIDQLPKPSRKLATELFIERPSLAECAARHGVSKTTMIRWRDDLRNTLLSLLARNGVDEP